MSPVSVAFIGSGFSPIVLSSSLVLGVIEAIHNRYTSVLGWILARELDIGGRAYVPDLAVLRDQNRITRLQMRLLFNSRAPPQRYAIQQSG
jgi:hypothetical protein